MISRQTSSRCSSAKPFRLRVSACLLASQGHPVTLALASQGPQSLSPQATCLLDMFDDVSLVEPPA
jgi:hypothetical protein